MTEQKPAQPDVHALAPTLRRLAAAARQALDRQGWPFAGSGEDGWATNLDSMLGGEVGAYCAALTPTVVETLLDQIAPAPAEQVGAWIVTDVSWTADHSNAVVYASEIEALRAANRDETTRAYFMPCGVPLIEVIKNTSR